jgi:hypothetical protein
MLKEMASTSPMALTDVPRGARNVLRREECVKSLGTSKNSDSKIVERREM